MNPMDLAQSLSVRVKGRAEKTKIETGKKGIEARLDDIKGLLSYLQSEESGQEDLSVRDLKKQMMFLQEMFRSEFTPEIKQLIDEVPEIDEKELREAENFLQQQAEEAGISVAQMLEQFSQDEDEEIRERAVILKQFLGAKNKIAFLKLKLREWMVQALGEMKGNTETELGMGEEELKDLEERFKQLEVSEADYPNYASEMGRRFADVQTRKIYHLQKIDRIRYNLKNANSYSVEYQDRSGNTRRAGTKEEIEIAKTQMQKEIERSERNFKIDESLWQDFFESFRQVVERKFPDESVRRNLLERIAGVTEPKLDIVSQSHYIGEVVLNSELFDELGEDASLVVEKFLRTKALVGLVGPKDFEANGNSISDFHDVKVPNVQSVCDYLVCAEQLSANVYLENKYRLLNYHGMYEREKDHKPEVSVNTRILKGIKTNPEFVNQVEAVLRARGLGRERSSPFCLEHLGTMENQIGLYGGNYVMPLQERDGIFFESADTLKQRTAQAEEFEQRLIDAVNSPDEPKEKVVVTRKDAVEVANNARQRARDAELVARRKGETAVAEAQGEVGKFKDEAAKAKTESGGLRQQLESLQSRFDALSGEQSRLLAELEALKKENQNTLTSLKKGQEYMAELNAAIFKGDELLNERNIMIRKITDALKGSGFGKNGAVVEEIKQILGF